MIGKPTRLLLASLSILMSTGAWADFTATPTEARAIAKEAYLYGYPVVEMYKTLYTPVSYTHLTLPTSDLV